MVFTFFLLLQVQPFFYVVVNYHNINNDFVQPHENFRMQFRIECGSHYNALHFKGVIIYRRSHNLPINNDSPSHYLPGNFEWGVIILGESLLTVKLGARFVKVAYVYISTENFLLPIPISEWLLFCCRNLILLKKRNENDEHNFFDEKQ